MSRETVTLWFTPILQAKKPTHRLWRFIHSLDNPEIIERTEELWVGKPTTVLSVGLRIDLPLYNYQITLSRNDAALFLLKWFGDDDVNIGQEIMSKEEYEQLRSRAETLHFHWTGDQS